MEGTDYEAKVCTPRYEVSGVVHQMNEDERLATSVS